MSCNGPVLVVGCGLIGTSLALALTGQGHHVHLADSQRSNVEIAVSRGAGSSEPTANPAIVVVAVPPSVAPQVIDQMLATYPAATVTDVSSVKSSLVDRLADHRSRNRFVGGHPMAGTEGFGPLAAVSHLFEGRPWVIVPTDASEPSRVERVEQMARCVGAVPRVMDAQTHDRAVALVSHLPHLASVAVAGLLGDAAEDTLELAGPGLRDVTRIAGSQTGLWLDILAGNASAVRDMLVSLRDRIDGAIADLDQDPTRLAEFLDAGRAGSQRIPGRHGGEREKLATVKVSVADQPGELLRLIYDTKESGFNIEDIRIDHELGRPVGQVQIAVTREGAKALAAALVAAGWTAYL